MSDLATLVREYIDHFFAEVPEYATTHGYPWHDDELPDLSADAFDVRARDDEAWHKRLTAIGDDGLAVDDRIDRDLVLSHLEGRRILRDWEDWRRLPDTYVGPPLNGLFALFLRRPHPEPELVRCAVARLDGVPALLDAGRANLDAGLATTAIVERSMNQCRAAVTYVRDLLPVEVDDDQRRRHLAEAGARAAEAYESFGAYLADLKARATGTWEFGEHRYTAALQEKELLAYDAASLRDRGQTAYDELAADMRQLAQRGWGTDDFRAVITRLADERPHTPEEMRDGYEAATERARAHLAANELVTLPDGERCDVVPSPPFLRPVLAVASYLRPPTFQPSRVGRFNVPYPPDGTSPEELAKRLANNSYAEMPTISVHEAYPGHHWHFSQLLANRAGTRPIRCVLGTSYFTEGWALYAEAMMRERGLFTEPAHELAHLDARLFRAARIVVDVSLHCGDMAFDEAVTFMRAKAGLTEPVARAEVTRYCAWPTQASSYLTGSFEVERLRERWFAEDRGDLRSFHDTICGSGYLPIALAERALFDA
ncbi:MAG: DUF885 domain-containing protein [Acidimicrobiales bacterium]